MSIVTGLFWTGFLFAFIGFAWFTYGPIVAERPPAPGSKVVMLVGALFLLASIWMGVAGW